MGANYWQREISRRRVLRGTALGAAGAASAAALAACGGGSSGGDKSASSSGSPAAAAAAGTPKQGGTIHTWSLVGPENPGLDSYLNFSDQNCNYSSMIYPKLTQLKTGGGLTPADFVVDLDLATKMEQPDQTTIIFTLNEKAKWQDVAPTNGRPLTAEDVAWNLQLYKAKGQNSVLLAPMDKAEAIDAKTLRIKLSQPVSAFPLYAGHPGGPFIMPRELKETDQTRDKTSAAGAFYLDKLELGTSITFRKNPNYYKAPNPNVDAVTYSFISDPSTLTANIRTGAIDLAVYQPVPWQDGPSLKSQLNGATWQTAKFMNISGWALDIDDSKYGFKDDRVRQALSVAVDRDGWFSYLGQPGGKTYKTPLPPYSPWWLDPLQDSQISQYYKRDVAKAKQLLSAAGFPNGIQDVPYTFNQNAAAATELASLQQSALKEANINVKLNGLPQAQWFQCCNFGTTPSGIVAGIGIFNTDPDEGLSLVFDPTSARSPVPNKKLLGDDKTLMDLMAKIKAEFDRNKRKGYVDDVQRHLSTKMYFPGGIGEDRLYFSSKKVKNMAWLVHYAYGPHLADIWIDES